MAAFFIMATFSYFLVADPLGASPDKPAERAPDVGTLAEPGPPAETEQARQRVNSTGPEPVDIRERHDFTQAEERRTFVIPELTNPLTFTISFDRAVVSGLRITVFDPNGAQWAEATSGSPGNVQITTGQSSSTRDSIHMMPGEWTVEFSGFGPSEGGIEITG